eukprot:UC1_evm1s837
MGDAPDDASAAAVAVEPEAEKVKTTAEPEEVVVDPRSLPQFSIDVLPLLIEYQQQHGLRRNDYNSYRAFCTRRLRRLRTSLHFLHGKHRQYKRATLTLERVTEARHLHLLLIDAERAWAAAMHDKTFQDEPRKGHHAVRRLRKAAKHADAFLELALACKRCDPRTELEATAYRAWIAATLAFELQQWDVAFKAFGEARLVYDKLAAASREEARVVYTERIAEIDANIRYCTYSIKGAGADVGDLLELQAAGGATGTLRERLDAVLAQTREREAETLTEVKWRGRAISVRGEKVRVAIIKARAKEDELTRATATAADKNLSSSSASESLLALYDELFMAYGDALGQVRDDIRAEEASSAKIMSQKSEAALHALRDLQAYLQSLRLERTTDRNLLLISQKRAAFAARVAGVKPDDFVRLYDTLLQNIEDLSALAAEHGDGAGVRICAARKLHYRADRCFYLAEAQRAVGKTREALLLFARTTDHAAAAQAHYAECAADDQGSSDIAAAKTALIRLGQSVRSRRCAVHAEFLLSGAGGGGGEEEGGEDAFADASDAPLSSANTLYEGLGTFDCSPTVVTGSKLAPFPPEMRPMPCKPLFFDLANNHIAFPDLSERTNDEESAGVTDTVSGLVKGVGSMLGGWFGGG